MHNAKIVKSRPSIVWITKELLNNKIDANLMHSKFINMLDNQYLTLESNIQIKLNKELIEELTDFTANGSFKSLSENVEYTDESGIPFVRIKNMSEIGLVLDDLKYITIETYTYLKKSRLQGNELLFSKTGANLGLAMVFPNNFGKASLADNTFKVIYKKEYDTHYIASFFNGKYGKLWTERLSQGSAQPTIIKENFRQIKIPIPSPEIQKYIGDKVRKAEELREEARGLKKDVKNLFKKGLSFKFDEANENYWYADTEFLTERRLDESFYRPEYLNIFRKMYEYKGQKRKLEDFNVDFRTGAAVSSDDFVSKGIPLIRIRDIGFDKLNFLTHNYVSKEVVEKFNKSKSEIGDIIVGMDGDDFRANIFVEGNPETLINQRITIIKSKDINPYYLYFYINSHIGQKQLQRYSVKTTVGHISTENIKNLIICIPEEKIYEEISQKIHRQLLNLYTSENLIQEAKQDVESLIEGTFDTSKLD